jgi:hypothetical protein
MSAQPQPGQRRWTQGLDRSKAAKLYIDNYYSNLLKRRQEREDRFALSPSFFSVVFFVGSVGQRTSFDLLSVAFVELISSRCVAIFQIERLPK